MKRLVASVCGLLLLCLCSGAAWGAGTVTFVSGTASAQRGGAVVPLAVGVLVKAGDVVRTDPASLLQMRMDDGALIALKASSHLSIDTYTAPPGAAQRGGRAILKLLKGGLRTLTGAIGKVDREEYDLETPVALIGIRGTDFSLLYCNADCAQAAEGLHARVSDGEILITNLAGNELLLGKNGYARVKDGNTPPERGLEAPQEMSMELPPPGSSEQSSRQPLMLEPDDEADSRLLQVQAPIGIERVVIEPPERRRPAESENLVFAHTPGVDSGVGAQLGGPSDVSIGGDGSLNGFNGADGRYDIGGAQQFDVGFDPGTGIRWGRWSGGDAVVGGVATSLENGSLAWIYGQPFEGTPALPRTGSAEFTLSGNTSPTDTAGNIGFLGSAALSANFSNQSVSSSLSLGIGNTIWNASGSGTLSLDSGLFGGSYDVTVGGPDGGGGRGSGQFNGFVVPDASGAGLGYSLTNGDSTVSGSAAFRAKGATP